MIKSLFPAIRFLLPGVFLLAACGVKKYTDYTSAKGDFRCLAPTSWSVMTEFDGNDFANTTFLGPFDPEFYLGVPSISIRWHSTFNPHRLPDGILEMYADADDYIRQTLTRVYGPDRIMKQDVMEVEVAGRKAKHFIVVSPVKVPPDRRWGVRQDASKKERVNIRQHAYVIIPMRRGFYSIIYPATRDGFESFEKPFNQVINSFEPLTDGPGGAPLSDSPAR